MLTVVFAHKDNMKTLVCLLVISYDNERGWGWGWGGYWARVGVRVGIGFGVVSRNVVVVERVLNFERADR